MQTLNECIPCFVRQAEEAVVLGTKDPARREKILRRILHALADADWADSPEANRSETHHREGNHDGIPKRKPQPVEQQRDSEDRASSAGQTERESD